MNNQKISFEDIRNMECHTLIYTNIFLFSQVHDLLNIFLGYSSSEIIILRKILGIVPKIIVCLIIP